MAHLSSCYFCTTALDSPVKPYELPDRGTGEQATVTLCSSCKEKLGVVLEAAGVRGPSPVDGSEPATTASTASPGDDDSEDATAPVEEEVNVGESAGDADTSVTGSARNLDDGLEADAIGEDSAEGHPEDGPAGADLGPTDPGEDEPDISDAVEMEAELEDEGAGASSDEDMEDGEFDDPFEDEDGLLPEDDPLADDSGLDQELEEGFEGGEIEDEFGEEGVEDDLKPTAEEETDVAETESADSVDSTASAEAVAGNATESGGGVADEPEPSEMAGGEDEPTDASEQTTVPEEEENSDDDDAGGGPSKTSLSALEYNRVMRMLQNREFPVDRQEIVAVASSAYDLTEQECTKVIDLAVDRGLLNEHDGELHRPQDD